MVFTPPTLTTARLLLREWREDDFDGLAAYKLDGQNWLFIEDGQPRDADDVKRILASFRHEWRITGIGRWAVEERESRALIGDCGFVHSESGPQLAYMIARLTWGRGYATEASRAALTFAFAHHDWPLVRASTHRGNLASQRVLRKLGFREAPLAGTDVSEVWFSSSRDAWTG